jgi:hypothetical protein
MEVFLMLRFIVVFILTLFISCTSCNSGSSKTDNDAVPDKDTAPDTETVDEDSDETPDIESDEEPEIPDVNDEEYIDNDYQGAEECPDLIDAKFPYYNDDKSIHFCRKCDKPTVKDPQCVENLWKDTAAALYEVKPEAECENGYPCDMDSIVPGTIETWEAMEEKVGKKLPYRPHECDRLLGKNPWAADHTAGRVKHFNISDGKVGLFLTNTQVDYKKYGTDRKAMEYDPATQKYRALAPSTMEAGAYNKGCMFHVINNVNYYQVGEDFKLYLAYSCTDGRRRVIYPRTISHLTYTPALNDNWVIANVQDEDGKYTMYAKVDDPSSPEGPACQSRAADRMADKWKWTKLMPGLSLYPRIVNDKVVFHDIDGIGWYCNLSKNPESIEDCVKINRENEEIRFLTINEDDETEVVYESRTTTKLSITKVVISKEGGKTYSIVEDTSSETDPHWLRFGYIPQNYRDGYLFYTELYIEAEGPEYNGNHCFYNISKKERICMNKLPDHPFKTNPNLGYGEWEGKWIVYQFLQGSAQAVRDLDCYCEKEGVCPLD